MKILMINKFLYPRGGSERYMFDLAGRLEANGHKIAFFGMSDIKNTAPPEQSFLVENLDFHRPSPACLLYPFKIIYSVEARKKITAAIKAFQPDVAHLNNYNFQLTPSIIYALKECNIPVVQTLHDPMLICPAHSLYNFQSGRICEKCKGRKYINCIKTKCIHGSIVRSALGALEGYVYYKLKTYDYIYKYISPSRFLADKLVEFGVKKEKIYVLPNFAGKVSGGAVKGGKDYFLYFGRIAKEKGIATLLEAVRRLPHIRFIVAGEGPLQNMLRGLPNLTWVGFKQGEELERLIRESIATLYPSVWYENCPMSILESFGLGIPVIGARIGGIPELIDDGVDGLLFRPGDAEDLAEKINRMYEQRNNMSGFSAACLEKIKRFTMDAYLQKITDIYAEAIQSSSY